MINIQMNINKEEQICSYINAALHDAPGGHAISIDAEAPIPKHLTTQEVIKAYLEEQLGTLSDQDWKFTILIGPAND